jgi:hypothetical protein
MHTSPPPTLPPQHAISRQHSTAGQLAMANAVSVGGVQYGSCFNKSQESPSHFTPTTETGCNGTNIYLPGIGCLSPAGGCGCRAPSTVDQDVHSGEKKGRTPSLKMKERSMPLTLRPRRVGARRQSWTGGGGGMGGPKARERRGARGWGEASVGPEVRLPGVHAKHRCDWPKPEPQSD